MSVTRAAGIIIYRLVNGSAEYLLLQASYPPYHWTPPKGHVDSGEDEWAAAVREVREEAAIELAQLDVHADWKHVQEYLVKDKPKTVHYWLGRLKIADIKLSHEHQKWEWAGVSDALQLTKYPEMAKMLQQAEIFIKSQHAR